jgi:hypothetical protein
MNGVLDSLDRADDLSKNTPRKRAIKKYSKEKDIEAYRRGKNRNTWGAPKFCGLLYSVMQKEGVEVRDELDPDGKTMPRHLREMALVLDRVAKVGYTRQEFALVLEFLAKEWYQSLGGRFPKNSFSIYDLRYRLEELFRIYRSGQVKEKDLPPESAVDDLLKGRGSK